MPPAETIALGLLQGPAELLPVSSSAHVGLLPWALGWRHAALPSHARKEVEVALHAGTALALAAVERRLERPIEARLGTPPTIAAGLLAGSVAMVLADRAPARRSASEATAVDGAWLGAAQAFALIPGVSRSGATRAAARARGFGRIDAAALSREVALPVLAGAVALKSVRLARRRPAAATVRALAAGAAAAAGSTWAALRAERALAADAPLAVWAAYRTVLAAAIVAVWQDRSR
jgi:undecaprenyl-diphosphatase